MKKLLPLVIALLGLVAGVGGGLALKPAPAPEVAEACAAPEAGNGAAEAEEASPAEAEAEDAADAEPAAAPCAPGRTDPVTLQAADAGHGAGAYSYVPLDKPFVVPVFAGEKVRAMVVLSLSLSIEVEEHAEEMVGLVEPRLRDSFLKAMFRHANSGGFDGSFTEGRKIEDLKGALLQAARGVFGETPIGEILITEINRQDV